MREFINDFPAKTEMNDNLTGEKVTKKVTALSLEQKNWFENIKQKYVAFQPPRNLNKKSSIFFIIFLKDFRFKGLNFLFILRVSAFTHSLPDSDTQELFNLQFLPTVSIYFSANSFGELRNLSARWCQVGATLHSLKIFIVIFVTFAKETQ